VSRIFSAGQVLLTVFLFAAPAAATCTPDPTKSTIVLDGVERTFDDLVVHPGFINVVGTAAGVPDPRGEFTITLRNSSGDVCMGVQVTVDFSQAPDVRLSYRQIPNTTLSCDNSSVTRSTDSFGKVSFTVIGASNGWCGFCAGPHGSTNSVRICAGSPGVLLGHVTGVVFDLTGVVRGDGIDLLDYEVVRRDEGCYGLGFGYWARSDYNHDFMNSPLDESEFAKTVWGPADAGVGSRSGSFGSGYCKVAPSGPYCP